MGISASEFADWTTGIAAIVTAVAVGIGAAWALWRYVLPGPFQPQWLLKVHECSVRRLESGGYCYTVDIDIENRSSVMCRFEAASLCILPPDHEHLEEDAKPDSLKGIRDEHEVEVDLPCAPHSSRTLHASSKKDELHDLVCVIWRFRYHRSRWLGMVGTVSDTEEGGRFVPVDRDSIELYRPPSPPAKKAEPPKEGAEGAPADSQAG